MEELSGKRLLFFMFYPIALMAEDGDRAKRIYVRVMIVLGSLGGTALTIFIGLIT